MQEINLLQSRVKDTTDAWQKQGRTFLSLLAMLLFLLIAAGVGLYFLTRSINKQNDQLVADNTRLQTELSSKEGSLEQARVTQAQLVNIKTLLSDHIYFSTFLDEIEKMTHQKAQYVSLTVAQSTGAVHLQGKTDSYDSLGKLLLGLSTSSKFSNVKLLSSTPSSGEVGGFSFSVDLTVSPDTFKQQK